MNLKLSGSPDDWQNGEVEIGKSANYAINYIVDKEEDRMEDRSGARLESNEWIQIEFGPIDGCEEWLEPAQYWTEVAGSKMDDSLANSCQVNGNRTDSEAKFSIFQMLDNSRRSSLQSEEQVGKTSCERRWCPANGGRKSSGERNSFRTLDFSSTDALLEELTVFNSSSRLPTAVAAASVRSAANAKHACDEERLLFRWLGEQFIRRGGLNGGSSQADGTADAASKNNIYNLRSEGKNERAAGELQGTVSPAVHQLEPFLKHLVDNDENETYQCLLLNHQWNPQWKHQCFEPCDPFEQFEVDPSRPGISRFADCPDDSGALITQTSEFVTTIRLDRPSANYDLNSPASVLCGDELASSLEQLASDMYALSGVPNGLKNTNQTTAASANYLPANGLLPSAPGQLLQHSTSMPSISAPIVSTSLVPVVLTSLHPSAALPHQPILHQNVHFITEKVQIFRQPGERIGLALNFNEGSANSDLKIERVFIQNVNPNSPASNAKGERLLGHLKENDELLCIENRPVNTLTRLDCVEILRDAGSCITLLVRGARVDSSSLTRTSTTFETTANSPSINGTLNRNAKRSPPQIPPRRETTVLSSVCAKDANQSNGSGGSNGSSKCDLSSSDKLNANNLKNSSLSTGTLKVLRRPPFAPPLPPPRKPITVSSSASEDQSTKRPNGSPNESSNGSPCHIDDSEVTVSASASALVSDESKANDSNGAVDSREVHVSDATSSLSSANNSIVLSESNVLNERACSERSGKDHRQEQLIDEKDSSTMRACEQTLNLINSINTEAPKQLDLSSALSRDKCERAGGTWSPVSADSATNEIKANQTDEQNPAKPSSPSSAGSHTASVQHQSSKNSTVSFAANISTSALQLMNSPNHINSPLQATSNHYLDLLNQRNVCIRIVLRHFSNSIE